MDQEVGHSNSRNSKRHLFLSHMLFDCFKNLVNITYFTLLLFAAIRTDLSMLLECLKFQMKCPDLQKQALLTLHSICEKRGKMKHK